MSQHVVPKRVYFLVFASLIALTLLTTGVAFIDLGRINTVVALAIAVCKMLLVILFFMHVRYSSGLTKIVLVAAFFWLAILIALSLSDYLTRGWTPAPVTWESSSSMLLHNPPSGEIDLEVA
jgi:cytochrome c oxidase subunit 4